MSKFLRWECFVVPKYVIIQTIFDESLISGLIRQAEQKGFHCQCPECHTMMDVQALLYPQCSKVAEKDDQFTRMQCSFQQLREACIYDAQLKCLKKLKMGNSKKRSAWI